MRKSTAILSALFLILATFPAPPARAQCIIPAQTVLVKTASYTSLAADTGRMIAMNCASACTLTLPSTPQSPNWTIWVTTIGAGVVTVSPNGLQLNGSASNIVIPPGVGEGFMISTDNTNYFAASVNVGFYVAGGGTAQAQTVTLNPPVAALTTGLFLAFLPAAANSAAAPTLAVNGLAAKNITTIGTAALNANDLTTTAIAYVIYDGTEFQLLNPQTDHAPGSNKQVIVNNNGVKGAIDFPQMVYVPAANCVNAVAGSGWSTGATPAALCRAGTNNLDGLLSPWGASDTAQFKVHLPNDWDSAASLDISIDLTSTDTTNGHTVIMQAATMCGKGDGSTTDDNAFNTAQSFSTITLNGNANRTWNATLTGLTKTGCTAGSTLWLKISRTTDTATNVGVYGATLDIARLLTVQAN